MPQRKDLPDFVAPKVAAEIESWLRHEVMPNAAKQDRISISFNYR